MNSDEDRHFLDYPELDAVMDMLYPSLLTESDRGAVLIALSVIDEQLNKYYDASIPPNTSNKRKKDIFSRTGPFGSLSSKLDIAYTCRMLPHGIVNSIHILRKLRNNLAHSSASFSLVDEESRIREAYTSLGDSTPDGIRQLAVRTIGARVMESLSDLKDIKDPSKPMFQSREEIVEVLEKHPTAFDDMNSQLPKHELIFATHLICGLIFMHQREYLLLHG